MIDIDLLLADADTVAISGHLNPDGDCAGSCLGMYNYMKEYYPEKKIDLYLDPIPDIFHFLRYSEEVKTDRSADFNYDLFISQDCGSIDRLGASLKYFENAKVTVNIDHHISNPGFADYNYVVPDASSTCELVYNLLPKEKINKNIAECIYVGIVHDTGVFQYSCTSKATMEAAGFLMECGIDYPKIVDETFFVKTYEQRKIYGLAFLKSQMHLDGKCISCVITKEDMEQYGAALKDLDGIPSQLRSTKGVEASIFVYETGEQEYKVSFRSAAYVDVSAISVEFGGGGHVRAAGCTVTGNPEEIVAMMVDKIAQQM